MTWISIRTLSRAGVSVSKDKSDWFGNLSCIRLVDIKLGMFLRLTMLLSPCLNKVRREWGGHQSGVLLEKSWRSKRFFTTSTYFLCSSQMFSAKKKGQSLDRSCSFLTGGTLGAWCSSNEMAKARGQVREETFPILRQLATFSESFGRHWNCHLMKKKGCGSLLGIWAIDSCQYEPQGCLVNIILRQWWMIQAGIVGLSNCFASTSWQYQYIHCLRVVIFIWEAGK